MKRDLKQPLFGCSDCYEEYSWHADDLGIFEGNLYCENCGSERTYEAEEDSNIKNIDFCDLPPFIPEHEKTINQLRAEIERLWGAIGERCAYACEEELYYCMEHCPITKALERRK